MSLVLKRINKYVRTFFRRYKFLLCGAVPNPAGSYAKLLLNRVLSFKMHFSPRSRVSFHAEVRAAFISFYFKSGIPVLVLAFHIALK